MKMANQPRGEVRLLENSAYHGDGQVLRVSISLWAEDYEATVVSYKTAE